MWIQIIWWPKRWWKQSSNKKIWNAWWRHCPDKNMRWDNSIGGNRFCFVTKIDRLYDKTSVNYILHWRLIAFEKLTPCSSATPITDAMSALLKLQAGRIKNSCKCTLTIIHYFGNVLFPLPQYSDNIENLKTAPMFMVIIFQLQSFEPNYQLYW